MNFLVWPPEVNSGLLVDGPGSAPMLEAAAAWDGVGTELSSAANTFGSVISDLATEAWQGPSSASMTNAITPYVGWLGKAAAQAEQSAGQARAAASAFEEALATVVDPASIATNRSQLLSLVRSNLFGQNAPSIAAAEAAYERMWAHDVAVMSGYHAGASATVAQLAQWEQDLEQLTGLSQLGQAATHAATQANTAATGFVNNILVDIFGTGASLPVPATLNPVFVGAPSLLNRVEVSGLWVVKEFVEPFIDNQLANTSSPLLALFANPIPPVKLFISNTPPKFLPLLFGETVQQTTFDGMSVVQITPAHPDGKYVVAIHGGAFIFPPSIFHWFDYAHMAAQTGATIEVPIYPLLQQGGTAGVVVPEMAGLISSEITAHGASNVSVYGDSAGGNLALAAAEYLVANNEAVPGSMVLLSPWLNVALNNPNIGFVHDPLLPVGPGQAIGKEWAGGLPENDYEVSPIYGSLKGLPPTYVYSGSLDSLGPDVVVLDENAATQGAPFSFVLRTGDIHDWILLSPDGFGYLPQIEQELGI
jgi:triacylglycerol lipase